MMIQIKQFLFLALLFFSGLSMAGQKCKVYGISDGPQYLNCQFDGKRIELKCLEGKYHLDKSQVSVAYHLEVENGPNPLVFKTDGLTLTVTLQNGMDKNAELETIKGTVLGICKISKNF